MTFMNARKPKSCFSYWLRFLFGVVHFWAIESANAEPTLLGAEEGTYR